ncbi:hypothetical protein COCNU_02G009630 [Cocos nucifera]|uniref:Uncharacterized protein n=1 Tax=Cocos nucifera TaxID=13894 RepID=A0A8K0MWN8_COCNU|nr:hypothetical protein COCNU_02G009620 [Cocos nucifera]KAG1330995.1 hypothetical protein COCNU_02G009630 [Cocos nucifera]
MGFGLADEEDRERKRKRSRDEKARREGFGLTAIVGHDGTEMPSSFHPYPSMGYVQFSIQGAIGAYSIHLGISCSGTSTVGIYSTDNMYSIDGIYSTDN